MRRAADQGLERGNVTSASQSILAREREDTEDIHCRVRARKGEQERESKAKDEIRLPLIMFQLLQSHVSSVWSTYMYLTLRGILYLGWNVLRCMVGLRRGWHEAFARAQGWSPNPRSQANEARAFLTTLSTMHALICAMLAL